MRPLVLVLLLSLALGGLARAAGFEVFVNNRPFEGAVSGPSADALLEAEPYFQQAGGKFRYDAAAGTATMDGRDLPVRVADGKVWIRARDVVTRVGGRYTVNADLGPVDIYAFDPVEAARKVWTSLMTRGTVRTQGDLESMNSLARSTLTRKLGMSLDYTVEVTLNTPEQMAAVGGGPNTVSYVSYMRRSDRNFIEGARIMLREGQRPQEAMWSLTGCWGTVWAVRQGHIGEMDKAMGFGFWAAWYVLHDAGTRIDPMHMMGNQNRRRSGRNSAACGRSSGARARPPSCRT